MKKILLLLTSIAFALSARADSVTLTNKTADELCAALQQLGVGLTGANAVKATRDLIALRPVADAYSAGLKAEVANRKITPATRTDSAEFAAYVAAVETFAESKVKVDLQLFRISDEEFERVAASTRPAILEIIVRHLEPKK